MLVLINFLATPQSLYRFQSQNKKHRQNHHVFASKDDLYFDCYIYFTYVRNDFKCIFQVHGVKIDGSVNLTPDYTVEGHLYFKVLYDLRQIMVMYEMRNDR